MKSKEKQIWAVLGSYVWDWHCRRRSNKWMALRRWLPVWRQATPTCHSQMSDSGKWPSSWSSPNICFSISKPDWWGKWRETVSGQLKPLSMFTSVLTWSTCLEPSSVASCNGELVAPLGIAHVWHESIVERITWQKDTLISSNVTEEKCLTTAQPGAQSRKKNIFIFVPHQESQNRSISEESHWSCEHPGGNHCCWTWWVHHSLPRCSSGSQILPRGRWPPEYAPCPKRERSTAWQTEMWIFKQMDLWGHKFVQMFRNSSSQRTLLNLH